MTQRLQWERDGANWPYRQHSSFVRAAGLLWHTQRINAAPEGAPTVLLIHGTGASTHSWRGLIPLLAPHFEVLAVDLPGHAFTDMPIGGPTSQQLSLPGMASALGDLLQAVKFSPTLVVGHSAGAAIGARMCLDGKISPRLLVSINGALLPLGGLAGQVFSPAAKLMAALPFVPRFFSWQATSPAVLQRLIDSTGSTLDAQGMALYGQLVANPAHAAGALGMMANWDLPQLELDLPRLATPLSLVVGSNDKTVSPRQAARLRTLWPATSKAPQPSLVTLDGLGHLAHEENPGAVASIVLEQFKAVSK